MICTAAVIQPLVTDELLAKLAELFPARPTRSMAHREIDHQIGQQEVITFLQRLREEQDDNLLGED